MDNEYLRLMTYNLAIEAWKPTVMDSIPKRYASLSVRLCIPREADVISVG
jgi:hypothetical protein